MQHSSSDPGHKKADEPRGKDAKYTTSKDGKWAKKGNKSYFRYKLHIKIDTDYELIREIETTPANTHDSQIDLSKKEEVAYRDKGYFGVDCKAYNATMDKASRNKPLKIKEKRRNKRISSKRAPGERPFAVIKTIFKSAHILVTTVPRVKIKNMMSCFSQPKTTKHNPKKQYQCSDSYLKFR